MYKDLLIQLKRMEFAQQQQQQHSRHFSNDFLLENESEFGDNNSSNSTADIMDDIEFIDVIEKCFVQLTAVLAVQRNIDENELFALIVNAVYLDNVQILLKLLFLVENSKKKDVLF